MVPRLQIENREEIVELSILERKLYTALGKCFEFSIVTVTNK